MAVKLVAGDPKLFKAKIDALGKKLSSKAKLRVGFKEDAKYPDGTSVAMVAYIQEYGSTNRGIPPRPFFRNAIKKNEAYWADALGALLEHNDFNVPLALQGLGLAIQGDIQQSIVDLVAPPLSPITLMLRMMKKLNTNDPFKKDGNARKSRVPGDSFKITGATVEIAARLVKGGKAATGVSTKPLIDTGVMLQSIGIEINE